VSRAIQELRKEELITSHGDTVVIKDWQRLKVIAGFDPTCLKAERR